MGVNDDSRFPFHGVQGASSPVLCEAVQLPPCLPEPAGRLSFDLGLLVCGREKAGFHPQGAENGGENPFSYSTPSRNLNVLDKTSPMAQFPNL